MKRRNYSIWKKRLLILHRTIGRTNIVLGNQDTSIACTLDTNGISITKHITSKLVLSSLFICSLLIRVVVRTTPLQKLYKDTRFVAALRLYSLLNVLTKTQFNIFYPDLIDKSKAPTFKIVKEPGNDETVLLYFTAGPPYEDIAFRIVSRDWEYSHKR